jgi:predicted nucleic acid-binding protein
MSLVSADTSSLVRFLEGKSGDDVDLVEAAFTRDDFRLTPAAMAELLSYPRARPMLEPMLARMPTVTLVDGYWTRVGETRRTILTLGLKARLGDALIAQACIDADIALIAHDPDFHHFEAHCGLKLAR